VWAGIYLGIGWFARGASEAVNQFKFGGAVLVGIIVIFLVLVTLVNKRLDKSANAMIADAEKAKERAVKLREADMRRPNR
jgi:hypothetical protein